MVRCKFKVISLIPTHATDGYTVMMAPVISGSKENEEFYHYTPGGSLMLSTINVEAAKQFEVGAEYYLDISKS